LAGAFFAADFTGGFLDAAFFAGAFFAGAFLAGAFFAVAMSIFSIKDVVDVPGVGESRMSSHFSQAPRGANSTARNTARKAFFPLRTRFFSSSAPVLSHAGITASAAR
jgi:hypothetical protein